MQKAQDTPPPVAQTFEAELASIKEKGKDFKGDRRDFYLSIVNRLENNEQVLSDLRKEHTSLRESLDSLVKKKNSLNLCTDLQTDIRRSHHRVNLLKKQIDNFRHKKQEAIDRQAELNVVLKSLSSGDGKESLESIRLKDLKNKLDNANIKNQETGYLLKVYNQIQYLLERQKMRWNTKIEEHNKIISQRHKDIAELTLVARDSLYSRNTATNEFIRMQRANAIAHRKREEELNAKLALIQSNMNVLPSDGMGDNRTARVQQSLNSQPSTVRSRNNRYIREQREQKFRSVADEYDSIREFFGTNDPDEIFAFFDDRRKQAQTLTDQIESLKADCLELEKRVGRTKSHIEEVEYTSAKGVGSNRLLTEGRKILDQKRGLLDLKKREMEAAAEHHKSVERGIYHLADEMALVQKEENGFSNLSECLDWVKSTILFIKDLSDKEDVDYVSICNHAILARKAADSNFDIHQVDSSHRVVRQRVVDPLRRPPKDNKNDIITRVLDRKTIKAEAMKALQEKQHQGKKKN